MPAFELHPTAEAGWLVGDALFQTGSWAAALDVLSVAEALPGSASVRVDLAVTRSNLQLWGLSDTEGAFADPHRGDGPSPAMQPENHARSQRRGRIGAGVRGTARRCTRRAGRRRP